MDAEALCTCGCPYRRHRPEISRGAVVLACFRHDSCEDFTADVPTEVAAIEPRTNEEARSVGTPDPRCHCGHLESQHRARVILGRYIDACLVCDCTTFGAVEEWSVAELFPTTLIYAWESWWCPTCGGRTFREGASCCDAPMLPVRLEMHSRDSPA